MHPLKNQNFFQHPLYCVTSRDLRLNKDKLTLRVVVDDSKQVTAIMHRSRTIATTTVESLLNADWKHLLCLFHHLFKPKRLSVCQCMTSLQSLCILSSKVLLETEILSCRSINSFSSSMFCERIKIFYYLHLLNINTNNRRCGEGEKVQLCKQHERRRTEEEEKWNETQSHAL